MEVKRLILPSHDATPLRWGQTQFELEFGFIFAFVFEFVFGLFFNSFFNSYLNYHWIFFYFISYFLKPYKYVMHKKSSSKFKDLKKN